jgi:hypothetical protein
MPLAARSRSTSAARAAPTPACLCRSLRCQGHPRPDGARACRACAHFFFGMMSPCSLTNKKSKSGPKAESCHGAVSIDGCRNRCLNRCPAIATAASGWPRAFCGATLGGSKDATASGAAADALTQARYPPMHADAHPGRPKVND